MEPVTATRSELLSRRARLQLAVRGRDLLDEKRDQLMEEFRRISDQVLSEEDALERAAAAARRALALAEAMHGPESVTSAGMAGRSTLSLSARTVTVMGVRLADIGYEAPGRPRAGRGYTVEGTSPHIDQAAARFETELEMLLDLAARELRLRRLVDEIGRTTRRVNALEHVVIPRLRSEVGQIQGVLEERERQDRFRIKRAKAQRSARRETR